VALESCIRTHPIVTAQLLARLYEAALKSTTVQAGVTGMSCSHIKTEDFTLGAATDDKTGIYVQLVKFSGKENKLLTVGSKWAMERTNSALGNTSITFW
jgi:hypothetical protein